MSDHTTVAPAITEEAAFELHARRVLATLDPAAQTRVRSGRWEGFVSEIKGAIEESPDGAARLTQHTSRVLAETAGQKKPLAVSRGVAV